jgi:hypothetical protein
MTTLALATSGLTMMASASDDADEAWTAEGIIVPWDRPGRTHLGPKRFRRGSLILTADAVAPGAVKLVGVYGHNTPTAPAPAVSRLIAHEDRPEGLWGRLRIARTPAGTLLRDEIRAGVRDGLSGEFADLQFSPEDPDEVISARVDFVAHVPVGAYDSARVYALAATMHDTTGEPVTQTAPAPAPEATPDLSTLVAQAVSQAMAPVVAQLAASAAPTGPSAATLLGVGNAPAAPAAGVETDPVTEAARLSAAVHANPGDQTLLAALADITASGLPLFQQGSSRLGEKLWEGAGYTRQFVGLMRTKPLTSMRYYGWQWTKRPEVKAWTGDKTEVPTGTVSLEQVPFDARRCAGGWDVDRKYKDFGDAEFWAEFYAAQTESYQELSDTWAAEGIVAAAVDVSDDANLSTLPADYADLVDATGVEAGPNQLIRAAAIGRVILEGTPRVKQGPDYVLVNPLDWLAMADTTALDLPAFLALLKVDVGSFLPTVKVPRGQVVMGVRNAMTYRELGGGAPIRVEALDVARGGVDSAVYGYVGISVERAGGVISVPLAAAA